MRLGTNDAGAPSAGREALVPRFFINFRNANKIIEKDEIGIDVPGPKQARAAAVISAREKLAENAKGAARTPLEAVFVTDERGQKLMTLHAKHWITERASCEVESADTTDISSPGRKRRFGANS